MITEKAKVASINGDKAVLHTERQSTCGQCAANKACGTYAMSKVMGNKRNSMEVSVPVSHIHSRLQAGDEVTVAIPESAFLQGTLILYGLPLGGLIAGAVVGQIFSGELASILCGFSGLAIGFLSANRYLKKRKQNLECDLRIL